MHEGPPPVNGDQQNYTDERIGTNNWQRLLSDGVNSYTYDANGNTATRTGYTFGSDYDNRLTSISGGATASYAHDFKGRRSAKTVGAASTYVYDGPNLIQEQGATPADYLFGPGLDEPLAMSRGGQTYYYETDALGSVAYAANTPTTHDDPTGLFELTMGRQLRTFFLQGQEPDDCAPEALAVPPLESAS